MGVYCNYCVIEAHEDTVVEDNLKVSDWALVEDLNSDVALLLTALLIRKILPHIHVFLIALIQVEDECAIFEDYAFSILREVHSSIYALVG